MQGSPVARAKQKLGPGERNTRYTRKRKKSIVRARKDEISCYRRYNNGTMELCRGLASLLLESYWLRVTLRVGHRYRMACDLFLSVYSLLPPGNTSFLESLFSLSVSSYTRRPHGDECNRLPDIIRSWQP